MLVWRKRLMLIILLLLAFSITLVLLPQLPLRAGALPKTYSLPTYADPGDDAFFIYAKAKELSHLALYHNIGDSIANAKQADILFFGNSRMQLGLRESVIVPAARELGLRVFSIATGHADRTDWALEIIRKYDLRPKIVVACGGPIVFTQGVSEWVEEVAIMSGWQARKEFYQSKLSWHWQNLLHAYLPKIDYFAQRQNRLSSNTILYRSEQTGWWRPVREPSGHYPIKFQKEKPSYEYLLPLAKTLKQELDKRDALLVLTMVPYARTRSTHLPFLAKQLDIPIVLPNFGGMTTSDGSHLDHNSAIRISQDFWQQFIALKSVRQKLSLPI